ncbi:RluA family pseudouridine synthase [Breznakiella homolactica]|uniref:RNA pseudouridine synthase n=1 Tax=Breznakiella homolactica TaxID=2798577 RepID=A0A7T7XRR7_9SPIR|nr:RNA pseudouridine synthase [Breznakiella homolactica]QQO11265.1 RNA pseudouridine synthase [Breznakiella homolactica]
MKNITVLYEDGDCIILNKPAGLAVQGGANVGASLDRLLAAEWKPEPLLVHRLDKDTSGVILAAKTRESARYFSEIIGSRAARKVYRAICSGSPEPVSGTISLPLEIRGRRKESLTQYQTIAGGGGYSLLELELGSGRMHQIRRHLSQIGTPVLGDGKYGDFRLNKKLGKELGLKRLLLHAYRMVLPLPGGTSLDISAPPPDYFANLADRLFGPR